MDDRKKKAYAYVAGYVFGTILMCCAASIVIALTVKFLCWLL